MWSALRVGKTIFKGSYPEQWHSSIWQRNSEEIEALKQPVEPGFVDKDGKFVTQAEARIWN